MIVVRGGSAKAPHPEGRPTRELQAVRRLRCGEVTFAQRPAACKKTRAVLIEDGKPTPRELRLPVMGGCVLWGNKGTPKVAVRSERGSSSAFFYHSGLSPGSPPAERTFVEEGDARLVQSLRSAFAAAIGDEYARAAEKALGREVIAHRSQSSADRTSASRSSCSGTRGRVYARAICA